MQRQLFERRIVSLTGDLDDEAANTLGVALMTLDATGDDPVRLQIDSGDGTVTAALAVMDIVDLPECRKRDVRRSVVLHPCAERHLEGTLVEALLPGLAGPPPVPETGEVRRIGEAGDLNSRVAARWHALDCAERTCRDQLSHRAPVGHSGQLCRPHRRIRLNG